MAEVDSYRLEIIDLVEKAKTECQGLLIQEKKALSGAESFSLILDSFNQFNYDEKNISLLIGQYRNPRLSLLYTYSIFLHYNQVYPLSLCNKPFFRIFY